MLTPNQWRHLRGDDERPSPGLPKSDIVKPERAASEARSAGAVTHTDHERHIHCGHLAHECRGSQLGDQLAAIVIEHTKNSDR